MKVKMACKICGKRAKRIPLQAGLNLCLKHYRLRIQEEEKKLENIF